MKEEFKSTSIAEMKMRDWFATQALTGLLAANVTGTGTASLMSNLAQRAYQIADAMLEARSE